MRTDFLFTPSCDDPKLQRKMLNSGGDRKLHELLQGHGGERALYDGLRPSPPWIPLCLEF